MFNKQQKLLKQLQDVQAKIKSCKATLAEAQPPAPSSFKIQKDMVGWLTSLAYDYHPTVDTLLSCKTDRFDCVTLDYLHELGEYFINIAQYQKEHHQYKKELMTLQNEERLLKEKLGIE